MFKTKTIWESNIGLVVQLLHLFLKGCSKKFNNHDQLKNNLVIAQSTEK